MEQKNENSVEELNIKYVIEKVNYYFSLLYNQRKLISLGIFVTIILVLLYSVLKKNHYTATSTFILEQSAPKGLAEIAALTFSDNTIQLDEAKIVNILTSRKIISHALLKGLNLEGKNDLLINHFISTYNLRENWEDNVDYPTLGSTIFTHANQDKFTVEENIIMNELYDFILEKIISAENSSDDILSLKVKTTHEELSKYFCIYIIESLKEFYSNLTIAKEYNIVQNLELKLDSIHKVMVVAESKLAKWKDESSTRLIKAQGYLEEIQLNRNVQVLNLMYSEVIKNLETSKFRLLLTKPTFQVIDSPVTPLEKDKIKTKNAILYGFVAGFLLFCLYVIAKDLIIIFYNQNYKQ